MTTSATDTPNLPAARQLPPPDTGPLSWVIVEIREALARSRTALLAAGGRTPDDQATQLQLARTHLHQAHGALQMLDLDGVSQVTALAETALERFKSGAVKCSTDHVEAVSQLYQALVRYLDELLAGAPSQPARLYPYYRAVLQLTGAERIHPADLFFPDLTHVVLQGVPADGAAPAAQLPGQPSEQRTDYSACRQRFERALLPYLKSTEPVQQLQHAAALRDAVTAVAEAQQDGRARTFWLAMQAFAELVAGGALAPSVQVKQLFGLINLQIRRLGQGDATLPEAMLRDALFFIAVAGDTEDAPTARLLRSAFALDGLVPADYETRRYDAPAADGQGAQWPAHSPAQWPDAAPAAEVAQVKSALRQVEQALDAFHAEPGDTAARAALAQLAPVIDGLQARLAALDQPGGQQAVVQVGAQLEALLAGDAPGAVDDVVQNVGALGFFADMLAQNAAGARERFAFDVSQGSFRAVPFRKLAGADTIPVLADTVAPPPVLLQTPDVAASLPGAVTGAGAEAAESLAIFIAEARDVLDAMDGVLAAPRTSAQDDEPLSVLRRSVNTLKGSARMVAQQEFAAAAQALERVLNTRLAEGRPADDALYTLTAAGAQTLRSWVDELAATGTSSHQADSLLAAADAVLALPGDADVGANANSDGSSNADAWSNAEARPHADPAAGASPEEIAPALRAIFVDEAAGLVATLTQEIGAWREAPRSPVSAAALKAAHTLAGASGTVGATSLRALAQSLEATLATLQAPAPTLDAAQFDLLDFTVARLRQMLDSFAAGEAPAAQPEVIEALAALRAQLQATAPAASNAIEARVDDLVAESVGQRPGPASPLDQLFAEAYAALGGSGATAGDTDEVPQASPAPVAPPQDEQPDETSAPRSPLDQLFDAAYAALSGSVAATGAADVASAAAKKPWKAAARLDDDIDDLFNAAFDDAFAAPPRDIAAPPRDIAAPAETAVEAPAEEPAPAPALAELPPAVSPPAAPSPASLTASPSSLPAPDTGPEALDPDLLPVFLEEGADLLPHIGETLRAWQQTPDDSVHAQELLRTLHTVKGSARMAGAMRLGQHVHDIESHVESLVQAGAGQAPARAFEELLAHYDHALLLFEQLHSAPLPGVADPAAAGSPETGAERASAGQVARPGTACDPAGSDGAPAGSDCASADEAPVGARSPLVRVRADILDRLVNQAGEVSIARSRLENEVGAMRGALAEVSDNLARLRRQLREIEVQAESQIASRMAIASTVEFDPLEFDRYTRLQELTRMMAESVNDAATLHESLARSADHAGDDLVLQARLTRELQRDLMRVRMVPFASISERLYRVARQSAKEVDKRVSLDMRGGDVEIDRSVLERMAAPFEHLLRNAIAHGIETRAGRAQAGKNETGELLVEASQQGNEVVIAFADDGAGLDLARIRAKARASGLLSADEDVSDEQVADLIFEPGFTTAEALTELSGRGVGMDIVQSEAQSLGGRVDLESTPGQGARFTVRLPLTLAVTQVVLVVANGRTYALPAILVEQVLQLKEAALIAAHAQGHVVVQDQQAALHYLPVLLGELGEAGAGPSTMGARSAPVVMLKNGNERLALQVDEVLGSREVVVKNIGPQLARMAGIAGATVLGSGDIVLILNPVALVQHLAQQPEARRQYAQAAMGDHGGKATLQPQARTVMVVDDSMTVRRVTQRLLEREGYRVLLAKDGVDALEQLRDVRPDLMLVDIEMPRMDGFDLTRNVRSDARTRTIPLIMITSRSADKHRQLALELGVNAFFGKPFPEPELLAAMRSLLAQDGVAAL